MIYLTLMISVCLDKKQTANQPTDSDQDSNPIIARHCWNEPKYAA
jgi:hypothetical protein